MSNTSANADTFHELALTTEELAMIARAVTHHANHMLTLSGQTSDAVVRLRHIVEAEAARAFLAELEGLLPDDAATL